MADPAVPKGPGPFRTPMKTPDYNPDREGHVGHTFVIHPSAGSSLKEIDLGDKKIKMNREGRAFVDDVGLAREIQKEHRFDAVVTRMAKQSPADRGHTYFFGLMPEMPWKRKQVDNGEQAQPDQPQDSEAPTGGLRAGTSRGNRPGNGQGEEEAAAS